MALFGWVFVPVILIGLLVMAVQNALIWAVTHMFLVNLVAAVLLGLNLLILIALLRVRARRRQKGVNKFRWLLLLVALWEGWVVFLCALFLIIQPLRLIPEHFLRQPEAEDCFGEWEIVSSPGVSPVLCTLSQEEIDACIGMKITYAEGEFITDGLKLEFLSEGYACKMMPLEQFARNYQTELAQLGLKPEKVLNLRVGVQGTIGRRQLLGVNCCLLGDGSLLIVEDGVFFRAERVGEPPF